jgi:formylglycine-generating enzyme
MIFPNNPKPFYFTRPDAKIDWLPIDSVSWNDVKRFLWMMSFFGHSHYRLASEAEWEYAARAGTTTSRYWGDNVNDACAYENIVDRTLHTWLPEVYPRFANCDDGGYRYQTAPVGSFRPNPWGLYDMLGNVFNWVEDCWVENYLPLIPTDGSPNESGPCNSRVLRGAAKTSEPRDVRVAVHGSRAPGSPDVFIGFRVARPIAP